MVRLCGTKTGAFQRNPWCLLLNGLRSWCPEEMVFIDAREGRCSLGPVDLQEGFIKASRTASVCQLGNGLAFCVLVTLQRNCSWVSGQH